MHVMQPSPPFPAQGKGRPVDPVERACLAAPPVARHCVTPPLPHPSAQLLTYQNLQPSPPSLVLLEAALGKLARGALQ